MNKGESKGELLQELAALRQELAAIGSVVDTSTDCVLRYDAQVRHTYANRAALELTGVPPDQFIGKTHREMGFPEHLCELWETEIERVFEGAGARTVEFEVELTGGPIWMELKLHPELDEAGRVTSVLGVSRDITQHKQALQDLVTSAERLRISTEVAGLAIWEYDVLENRISRTVNYDQLYGLEYQRQRTQETFLEATHPDDREPLASIVASSIATGGADEYRLDFRVRWPDRSLHWLSTAGEVTARDAAGRGLKVHGLLVDITERKLLEERRLSLELQVQEAQKLESLGVLAGGIAHDFNNLLLPIMGNADLLLEDLRPGSPARACVREIQLAAKRAAELATQMLAYSGRGRFRIEQIDLGTLVREMGPLLSTAISKKADLRVHFAEDLPRFDGDTTQILQVVMNLITNASEAIGDSPGVISLSTDVQECDRAYLDSFSDLACSASGKTLPEGVYVFVEVQDTGCGMDAETRKRLFEPFFSTKFTGRGLGMAAVLGIVRGHKGAIRIESEVGRGSRFTVIFPAGDRARVAANGIQEASQGAGVVGQEEPARSGMILLVDDEGPVREIAVRMIQRLGFRTLTASDGLLAVEQFRMHADEISCVLLDLTMPRMDGVEAFRAIRRIRGDARVVLCSGYSMSEAVERFGHEDLAGFVQKPYSLADLRVALADLLGS